MQASPYTPGFYAQHRDRARSSADILVPLLVDLIGPRHVVDVGCGTGIWLAAFRRHGVDDVCGIDGTWVEPHTLLIPTDRFLPRDLRQPLELDRTFDLAISLEVAEHLPSADAATFVASLTRLAPVVVFSAAIPHQGGTDHVNEQWPEYWVAHFTAHDYVPVDRLRRSVWDDPGVEWFYAQNMLLFVRRNQLADRPRLLDEAPAPHDRGLALVHPQQYLDTIALMRRLHETAIDLVTLIPRHASFVLVDDAYLQALEAQFGVRVAPERQTIPFLERDGRYGGPAADSATAIAELERLRAGGARFVVFAWTGTWWLDHYREFRMHLESHYRCRVANTRVVAFELVR